jgi:nucleotide-binding universal stress UspA family protein
MFKRILVATDGSSYSEKAVEYALDMADSVGAELLVLHVATIDPGIGMIWEEVKDQVIERQGTYLKGIVEKAGKRGVNARSILLSGIPSEKIIQTAECEGADLIILGSHGHTGLGKILVGSVAERVIGGTDIPVTVITRKKA